MTWSEKRLVDACIQASGGSGEAKSLYTKVWSVLGKIVERELAKGSRVFVPQLGTFGVKGDHGAEGWPFFEPRSELLQQFRMDYEGPRAERGERLGPVAELKPGSISRSIGYDQETCRIAYDDLMQQLRRDLSTGEKFELNLRVGVLTLLPAGHLLFSPKPVQMSGAPPKGGGSAAGGSTAGGASLRSVEIPEFCPVPPPLDIRKALSEKFRADPDELKVREMEALLSRRSKREVGLAKNAPQTARAVLQENKVLAERKAAETRRERSDSLDMVEQLLAQEQVSVDNERAKHQNRRTQQTALAQQYKQSIAQKEKEKEGRYEGKLSKRADDDWIFPFTEGETVQEYREHANSLLREEMREFVSQQRKENPPRADTLMDSVKTDYNLLYPLAPNARNVGGAAYLKETVAPPPAPGRDIVPYVCEEHPRFLKRSREYLSRRTETGHVRKAMEDKIERTKDHLELMAKERHSERRMQEDGLIINDALRYDNELQKTVERRQNAEYVRQQIEERKDRKQFEKQALRKECAGYYGPEEKNVYTDAVKMQHRRELVAQMEVNQNRRLDSRDRRLRQERCLVENGVLEMLADRDRAAAKADRRKSALNRAWNNQVQIRHAMKHVDQIGR